MLVMKKYSYKISMLVLSLLASSCSSFPEQINSARASVVESLTNTFSYENLQTDTIKAINLPELSSAPIIIEDVNINLINNIKSNQDLNIPAELITYEPGPYRIGDGDKLLIYVYGETERLSAVLVAGRAINPIYEKYVRNDGTIFYPNAGIITVRGKTVEEVRKEITSKLSKVLNDPQVDVSVTEYNSQKAILSGIFSNPGPHALKTVPVTLGEIVSKGNPYNLVNQGSEGDLTSMKLNRDGVIYNIDYEYLSRNSQLANLIYIKDGDVIHIPDSSLNYVYVLGEAADPKSIKLSRKSIPLSTALGEAKGLDLAAAKNKEVYIFRSVGLDGKPRIFNLDMSSPAGYILADKFELNPRDIVYIGSKGVTSWSRFISQLLPITNFINSSEDIGRN